MEKSAIILLTEKTEKIIIYQDYSWNVHWLAEEKVSYLEWVTDPIQADYFFKLFHL